MSNPTKGRSRSSSRIRLGAARALLEVRFWLASVLLSGSGSGIFRLGQIGTTLGTLEDLWCFCDSAGGLSGAGRKARHRIKARLWTCLEQLDGAPRSTTPLELSRAEERELRRCLAERLGARGLGRENLRRFLLAWESAHRRAADRAGLRRAGAL